MAGGAGVTDTGGTGDARAALILRLRAKLSEGLQQLQTALEEEQRLAALQLEFRGGGLAGHTTAQMCSPKQQSACTHKGVRDEKWVSSKVTYSSEAIYMMSNMRKSDHLCFVLLPFIVPI